MSFPRAAEGSDSTLAGIANLAVATLLFGSMEALVKWLSTDYSVWQLIFARAAFGMLPLAWVIHRAGGFAVLRTSRPGVHVTRALIGIVTTALFFLAYAHMPLADAIAIGFTGPLFLTVLSVPLLGETVGPRRWAALGVGFLGVLLIARPGGDAFGWLALLPLFGALGYALAVICVRRMSRTESNAAIVFYHTAACALVSSVALPFVWVTPDLVGWIGLVAVGVIGGTAQMFMTQAFRLTPAAVVAPFDYSRIILAIGFGVVLFADMPDSWTLTGAGVVIACGLYILHREAVRRAGRSTVPAAGAVAKPARA